MINGPCTCICLNHPGHPGSSKTGSTPCPEEAIFRGSVCRTCQTNYMRVLRAEGRL